MCAEQAMLIFSASQAFLLNLAIFWCTTANSPVATTVTGMGLLAWSGFLHKSLQAALTVKIHLLSVLSHSAQLAA
jgi:hypothetical protein